MAWAVMDIFVRSVLVLVCLLAHICCFAGEQRGKLVVLFTADLHSSLLQQNDGRGGAARLATIVKEERRVAQEDNAAFLLLDAGDIAMGSIFHTVFSEQAIEYRTLARLGYDAFTFGNHDFDFGIGALARMFAQAHSLDTLLEFPRLLSMNLFPEPQHNGAQSGYADTFRWDEFIEGCTIFERNGVKAGVFGIMGENSFSVIGKDAGNLKFDEPVESAVRAVKELQDAGADYIIAVSHGGTLNGDDLRLASKVKGIDLIISAHDHDLLHTPLPHNMKLQDGGVPVVAAGAFGKFVGKAVFSGGRLESYNLIEVGEKVPQEAVMAGWVDSMYNITREAFMARTGSDPYDTIAVMGADMPKAVDEKGYMAVGSNIGASYRCAAGKILGDSVAAEFIGVVPYGVVRKGLDSGAVTVKDVFEVLSLGENDAGYTGYPLVYAWLSGRELADLCEMSVSVSPFMEDTRLFFSGVEYSYNGLMPPFFKVEDVKVHGETVDAEKLYPVVTGSYTAGLIGLLEKESYGLLSAVVKDRQGNPLEVGKMPVLRTPDGRPVTEWMAFAGYIREGRLDMEAGYGTVTADDSIPGVYFLIFAIAVVAPLLGFALRRGKVTAKG